MLSIVVLMVTGMLFILYSWNLQIFIIFAGLHFERIDADGIVFGNATAAAASQNEYANKTNQTKNSSEKHTNRS